MRAYFIALAVCADSEPQSPSSHPNFQNACMRNFFGLTGQGPQFGLLTERLSHGSADFCNWAGLTCTDSALTSIYICGDLLDGARTLYRNPESIGYIVDIHWLPPTVEFAHFRHILLLHGWHASALPRRLKYLHLRGVHSREFGGSPWNRVLSSETQLKSLPECLEELFIIGSWQKGSVSLLSLPPRMQRLYISGPKLHTATVASSQLPETLKCAYVQNGTCAGRGRKVKVVHLDESASEPRFRMHFKDDIAFELFLMRSEVYYGFCQRMQVDFPDRFG